MQQRPFGSTRRSVPVIGQGTWNIEEAPPVTALAALRRGLDEGATHIDTAEMYGSGQSEEIIAQAIQGRRDEVFLVSKVLPNNASKAGTIAAAEKSLKRLKTDRLDCYLLHWRGRYNLADTVAGFEALKEAGKIRAWGVSNFDVDDLEELAELGTLPACNQVLYHLQERAIEHAVLPWCETNKVALVGYSPFGSGDFPATTSSGGRVLKQIADAHGVSPRAVALAFLVRRAALFTIPKAAKADHVADNAAAGDLILNQEEMGRIDDAFPLGKKPRSLPMI
jgi:diketogulonate reductase-like aldo/keto reductase